MSVIKTPGSILRCQILPISIYTDDISLYIQYINLYAPRLNRRERKSNTESMSYIHAAMPVTKSHIQSVVLYVCFRFLCRNKHVSNTTGYCNPLAQLQWQTTAGIRRFPRQTSSGPPVLLSLPWAEFQESFSRPAPPRGRFRRQ